MKTTVYRYYCRFRPPMPGAIPRQGLVRAFAYDYKQSIGGVGTWGFAEYDRPLTAKEIEAQAEAGKVGFGRLWSDQKADKAKAVQTAIQAFADGLVRVLMDEAELTELDEPLSVHEGAVFTFVRLTFLAGRMW